MILLKFSSSTKAKTYEKKLTRLKFYKKQTSIKDLFLMNNYLFVFTINESVDNELGFCLLTYSNSGCELVPYNRQIFEITKIRYKEFYEKCIPLENFATSEVQLCSLYFELLNGSKYYSFIGENAEEYAKSLVSYQYSINDILFNEISNIDELKEWIGRASSKKKVRNLIINRNADFVNDNFLAELDTTFSNPFINYIITCDTNSTLPDCFKKIYVNYKKEIKVSPDKAVNTIRGIKDNNTHTIIIEGFLGKKLQTSIGMELRKKNNCKIQLILSGTTREITESAFENCNCLINVKLGNTIKVIKRRAFSGCKNLTNITLPKHLTIIHEEAFYLCFNLVSLELPSSIRSINRAAFAGCENIINFSIPAEANLKSIDEFVFHGCRALKTIELPDKIKILKKSSFADCQALNNIKLPKQLCRIETLAFNKCYRLKEIIIPDNTHHIERSVFVGCKNLKMISLSPVLTLDLFELQSCCSHTKIIQRTLDAQKSISLIRHLDIGTYIIPIKGNLNIKQQKLLGNSIRKLNENIKIYLFFDGITSLQANVFSDCNAIYGLEFTNSIKSLTPSALTNCKNIREMYIPSLNSCETDIERLINLIGHQVKITINL